MKVDVHTCKDMFYFFYVNCGCSCWVSSILICGVTNFYAFVLILAVFFPSESFLSCFMYIFLFNDNNCFESFSSPELSLF